MKSWIQASVTKMLTNRKTTKMGFLIDAYTMTEAEARITEYFNGGKALENATETLDEESQERIKIEDFRTTNLQFKNFEHIIGDGSLDYWYHFRISYENDFGKEKKFSILINANDFQTAYEKAEEYAGSWAVSCEVKKGEITDIIEVMKYTGPARKEDDRQMDLFGNLQTALPSGKQVLQLEGSKRMIGDGGAEDVEYEDVEGNESTEAE